MCFKKTYFYITPLVAAFGQQKGLLMLAHFINLLVFQWCDRFLKLAAKKIFQTQISKWLNAQSH